MERRKPGWGVIPFLLALVAVTSVLLLWYRAAGAEPAARWVSWLPLPALLGVLLLGYFNQLSFPRVPNLKVVLFGNGISLVVTIFLLVREWWAEAMPSVVVLACGTVLLLLMVVSIVPEVTRHRTIRWLRGITLVTVPLVFVVGLGMPSLRFFLADQFSQLTEPGSVIFLLFSTAAMAVFALALFSGVETGGIGGMHAGTVLVLAPGWVLPSADLLLHSLVHTALPLYLAIATGLYWFRRLDNRGYYDPELRIYNRGRCNQILREQFPLTPAFPMAVMMIVPEVPGDIIPALQRVTRELRETVLPVGTIARFDQETLVAFLPGNNATDAGKALRDLRRRLPADGTLRIRAGIAARDSRNPPLETLLMEAQHRCAPLR